MYVEQLQKILEHVDFYLRFPPGFVRWLEMIVYPQASDPLRQLPWPKGQTQFKMPTKWYFNSKDPTFQNLTYPLEVSNIQSSSYLLEFVARAYEAIPPGLFDSFELPDPNLVECLPLTYAQCITLDLLPWVQIVRQSYSRAFYQREVAPAWTVEALEEFVFVMLDDPDEYLLDQFMGFLIEPIESSDVMFAVFRGDAPYTNDNLKKLAAAGSSYFDTLYYQITAMYGLQTSGTQDLPAPKQQLRNHLRHVRATM